MKNSASDIHIGAGERPLMRVDGLLRAAGETVLSEEGFEQMLGELGCRGSEKFKKERELDFGCEITVNGEKTRLRVNLSYSLGRPAAAIRIIPPRVGCRQSSKNWRRGAAACSSSRGRPAPANRRRSPR